MLLVRIKRVEGAEGEIGAEEERVGETLTLASTPPSASPSGINTYSGF